MEPTLPAAPPTEQGDFRPRERPSGWPTVIGVIAVVFGSLGILGNVWVAVAPWVISAFPAMTGGTPVPMPDPTQSVIGAILYLGAAALLLIGGVGLLKREANSVSRLKTWSIIKIALAVGWTVFILIIDPKSRAVMTGQGPGPMAPLVLMVVTYAIGLSWVVALPVFLLVWFKRPVIKAEVGTWGARA